MLVNWKTTLFVVGGLALIASAPVSGCSSDEDANVLTTSSGQAGSGNVGGGVGGSGAGSSSSGGGSGGGVGGLAPPTEQVQCDNKLYECGDLEDNDNDGLVDYLDPDCLGPCDNTEDSLYPDLPGGSGQDCDIDCYWDNGNGHDEECYWDHHCDPHSDSSNTPNIWPQSLCEWDSANDGPVGGETFPPSPYDCDDMYSNQPQTCIDECLPMAPNGCDCFGCCELGGEYVWIGTYDENGVGTCDLEDVGTPNFFDECHPCVPVPGCDNPCGYCELCLGKTTLPDDCYPGEGGGGTGGSGQGGAPPTQCPPELQACGLPGQDPCPSGAYCITGCCVVVPK